MLQIQLDVLQQLLGKKKIKQTKTNQNKCHALVTSAQALAGMQDVTAQ